MLWLLTGIALKRVAPNGVAPNWMVRLPKYGVAVVKFHYWVAVILYTADKIQDSWEEGVHPPHARVLLHDS